jgi:enoyl-[acyl-carrier-protein] reductase (NADH)
MVAECRRQKQRSRATRERSPYEAGRKWGMRVNTISAGPARVRAASAIGIIERMVTYCSANSP